MKNRNDFVHPQLIDHPLIVRPTLPTCCFDRILRQTGLFARNTGDNIQVHKIGAVTIFLAKGDIVVQIDGYSLGPD
jgi:hypothetical protein